MTGRGDTGGGRGVPIFLTWKNRRPGYLEHDDCISEGQELKESKKRKKEKRGKAHSPDTNDQFCIGYCSNMGHRVTYTGHGNSDSYSLTSDVVFSNFRYTNSEFGTTTSSTVISKLLSHSVLL
jgi:hypothetical protein